MKLALFIIFVGISQIFCDDISEDNNQVEVSSAKLINANDTNERYNVDEEQLSEDLNNNITQIFFDLKNIESTVIQRRKYGNINFYRNWEEYKNGFGDLEGDFFIGLERLYQLTSYGPPQELIIILNDFEYNQRYAKYDHFVIGSEEDKYLIKELGEYSGNAGDSMSRHKYRPFSTYDQNNGGDGCARIYMGAWWFNKCYDSHLNGLYVQGAVTTDLGINWKSWRGTKYSLKSVEMRLRPKLH